VLHEWNKRPYATLGDNGGEDNLQEIFDRVSVSGPVIDAVADQIPAAYFTVDECNRTGATLLIELAGYSRTTTFGIFDAEARSNRAQIFGGKAEPTSRAAVTFHANGDVRVNGVAVASDFGRTFGFYLGVGGERGQIYYSDDRLNPNQSPQALIYQGNDATELQWADGGVWAFSSDQFIIAFEDQLLPGGDRDFQDLLIVMGSLREAGEQTGSRAAGRAVELECCPPPCRL
jgi:hypothetical protein